MERLNISVLFLACLAMLVVKPSDLMQSENSFRGSDSRHANFLRHPRVVLDVSPMAIRKVLDAMDCALECVRNARCLSFNVKIKPDADNKFDCQLLSTDKYNYSSHNLKSSKEFDYHRLLTPCESSPCQNGGTCHSVYGKLEYKCGCAAGFLGVNSQELVKTCRDVFALGVTKDGVYTIRPDEQGPLKVYCDQTTDGGGWTVLQRRVSPFNTNFNRSWEEYRTGFGNLTGEFWLGNDNIHRLTATPVSFRIDYREKGNKLHARYENFVVAGADDKYRWDMDSYSDGGLDNAIYGSGTAAWREKGMQFSTPDNDNDGNGQFNCALSRSSGWWYNYCGLVGLNDAQGPRWSRTLHSVKNIITSYSDMKVRPP